MKRSILKKINLCAFLFLLVVCSFPKTGVSQALPFKEIPAHPEVLNNETMLARLVEGIGFRYYWATEGLRSVDLKFRPSREARSSEETIDHILSLTQATLNACIAKTMSLTDSGPTSSKSFQEKRAETLETLYKISQMLRSGSLKADTIKFKFEGNLEFPVWNLLNGPLEDIAWHTGQVVTFRRSSGNPINPKANVFTGKLDE